MAYYEKKLTKKEVSLYLKQYQEKLPGWDMIRMDVLARFDMFVAQNLWFERISGGEYRPMSYLSVLVAEVGDTCVGVLHQDLNVRVREASRREHPLKFERMVEAMCSEFVPSFREPLTTEGAYTAIIGTDSKYHVNEAFALVSLAGAMGLAADLKKWTEVFHDVQNRLAFPNDELEVQQREFVEKVNSWMSLPDGERVEIFRAISDRNRDRLQKL